MPDQPELHVADQTPTDSAAKYRTLPAQIAVAQTVPLVDVTFARDPEGGRDTETEWLLRSAP